ncbi:MAG: helix-turn-helix domain-containing protein [Candidatus Izemoplasmatales bacterium]
MIEMLLNEIARRKEASSQFYYGGIGQTLRKRRLELKMTQEAVAVGICSNTYLSKIENNQIVVNREHLYLIMERMQMDMDKITFPEEMLEYLEKSIKLFFYRDIEGYRELFETIDKYQFSVLLQIIKLGYYMLIEDSENARLVYSETFRYLQSLEEFGFCVLLLYSSFYNIGIKDYKTARTVIENVESRLFNDEMIYGLYNYCKFLIYGNLHLQAQAFEAGQIAINIFNKHSNIIRINEMYMYREIFLVYEGGTPNDYVNHNLLKHISDKERNYYLIAQATKCKNPIVYLKHLVPKGESYLLGLYLQARFYLLSEKIDEFKETCNLISDFHYQINPKIDYLHVLKLMKNKENIYLKDYLINHVLPIAIKNQNIYFLNMITITISKILSDKNRYKDSLSYRQKYDDFLLSQQIKIQIS